ncbi:1-cys peroxiredoxin [Salix suchowensis]|nr:1-cys peroxiredoxin [Salix suchowensis]
MKPERPFTKQQEGFLYLDPALKPRHNQGFGIRVKLPGSHGLVIRTPLNPASSAAAKPARAPPVSANVSEYDAKHLVVRLPTRPAQVATAPQPSAPLLADPHDDDTACNIASASVAPAEASQEPTIAVQPPEATGGSSFDSAGWIQPSEITLDGNGIPSQPDRLDQRPPLHPLQTTFTPPMTSPPYGSPYANAHTLPHGVALNQHGMAYELATGRPVYFQTPMPPMYDPRPIMHPTMPPFVHGHVLHHSMDSPDPTNPQSLSHPQHPPPINNFIDPATGTPIFSLPRQSRIEIRAPTEQDEGRASSSKLTRRVSGLRGAAATFEPSRPLPCHHPTAKKQASHQLSFLVPKAPTAFELANVAPNKDQDPGAKPYNCPGMQSPDNFYGNAADNPLMYNPRMTCTHRRASPRSRTLTILSGVNTVVDPMFSNPSLQTALSILDQLADLGRTLPFVAPAFILLKIIVEIENNARDVDLKCTDLLDRINFMLGHLPQLQTVTVTETTRQVIDRMNGVLKQAAALIETYRSQGRVSRRLALGNKEKFSICAQNIDTCINDLMISLQIHQTTQLDAIVNRAIPSDPEDDAAQKFIASHGGVNVVKGEEDQPTVSEAILDGLKDIAAQMKETDKEQSSFACSAMKSIGTQQMDLHRALSIEQTRGIETILAAVPNTPAHLNLIAPIIIASTPTIISSNGPGDHQLYGHLRQLRSSGGYQPRNNKEQKACVGQLFRWASRGERVQDPTSSFALEVSAGKKNITSIPSQRRNSRSVGCYQHYPSMHDLPDLA